MINMIICTGKDGELGKDNKLLWNIPEDLKVFKDKTLNKVVVLGRKTFEGLPFKNGLPSRDNIILSSKGGEDRQGVTFIDDIRWVLYYQDDNPSEEIWICGGSRVYSQFKDYVQEVHWTKIDKVYKDADTFFDMSWVEDEERFKKVEEKELTDGVEVLVYTRKDK